MGVPILLAGVTTIIGFLSFAGAYLTAVTEFGLFTALGVFFAMTLSLVFLPAALKALHRMQKFLGAVPRVNNVQSIADLVCRMSEVMNGRSAIPETRGKARKPALHARG